MKLSPADFKQIDLPIRSHNPSIIRRGNNHWLMVSTYRADKWENMHKDQSKWETRPVFSLLRNDMSVVSCRRGYVDFADKDGGKRIKDYRLFQRRNQVFSNFNFSVYTDEINEKQYVGKVFLGHDDSLITEPAQPQPDFRLAVREQNRSYFERNGDTYFLHSLCPWTLLKENGVISHYTTVRRVPVEYRLPQKQLSTYTTDFPLSISSNAIQWDDTRYMVLIHSCQPCSANHYARLYRHWMVLFDAITLLPTEISECVLDETGTVGDYPEIIFISGAANDGNDVIITAGLGDTFSGYARIAKNEINFNHIG